MTPFYTILTNYGKTVLTEALAAQQPLKIPYMAAGDGGGEYYDPTEAQTNLRNERWRGDLNDLRTDESLQGQIIAEAIIPMDIEDGDWTVREIGLFDEIGGLIAVGKYPEAYIPSALSGAKTQTHISIIIKIGNVAAVELIVDHAQALASKQFAMEGDKKITDNLASNEGANMIATSDGRTVQERLDTLPSELDPAGTAAKLLDNHNHDVLAHPELSVFITAEADRAGKYATQAEMAKDVATQASTVYATATLGQSSNLPVGSYFWVISAINNEVLELWKKGSTSPTKTGKSTPSASVTHSLNQNVSGFFYLADSNNKLPPSVVEQATGNSPFDLYLKFNRDIRLRALNGVLVATWIDIKRDINNPDLFVTSPSGVEDCLKLNDQALIYDKAISKFSVVAFTEIDSSKHYTIAVTAYGQLVGGIFFSWWLRNGYQSLADGVSTQFYLNNGNKQSSIPIIEQARDNDPFDLYIRLNEDIRILTHGALTLASWDKIKSDIDNPLLFTTSYSGVEDCLKLRDQALIYDNFSKKFQVIPRSQVDAVNHVLLAYSVYGQLIAGLIFDWFLSKRPLSNGVTTESSTFSTTPKKYYIAHGGMNGFNVLAPFNTLPSYRLAGEYGYYGAETDLVLSKDRQWVLCHDEVLDYYTNGTGKIQDYTLAELKQFDASKKSWSHGWRNVPLATLEEYLQVCVQYGMRPFLEIKATTVTNDDIDNLVSAITKCMSISEAVVMTFDTALLRRIRGRYKDLPIAYLTFAVNAGHIQEALSLGNCLLNVQSTSTQAMINQARSAGLQVAMWTLNQSEIDSSKTQGIKFITTDAGIPSDYRLGTVTQVIKNTPDFNNFTHLGGATPDSGMLSIQNSTAYIDINVTQGHVITVSVDAKIVSGLSDNVLIIQELDTNERILLKSVEINITADTFTPIFTASVAIYPQATKFRVIFQSGEGAEMIIRDLKIRDVIV